MKAFEKNAVRFMLICIIAIINIMLIIVFRNQVAKNQLAEHHQALRKYYLDFNFKKEKKTISELLLKGKHYKFYSNYIILSIES